MSGTPLQDTARVLAAAFEKTNSMAYREEDKLDTDKAMAACVATYQSANSTKSFGAKLAIVLQGMAKRAEPGLAPCKEILLELLETVAEKGQSDMASFVSLMCVQRVDATDVSLRSSFDVAGAFKNTDVPPSFVKPVDDIKVYSKGGV